eukprot:Colp12_sorted_trinity150504_noHs@293
MILTDNVKATVPMQYQPFVFTSLRLLLIAFVIIIFLHLALCYGAEKTKSRKVIPRDPECLDVTPNPECPDTALNDSHNDADVLGECTTCVSITKLINLSMICKHVPWLCIDCAKQYINVHCEDSSINCSFQGCKVELSFDEIQAMADPQTFRKYDAALLKKALVIEKGYVECPYPECGKGQIQELGNQQQFRATCIYCKQLFCTFHKLPWHTGLTCEAYDARQIGEQSSIRFIRENAKKCPKCDVPIEKNDGCNHMTCSRCRHEFCWLCLSDWATVRKVGATVHEATCKILSKKLQAQIQQTSTIGLSQSGVILGQQRSSNNLTLPATHLMRNDNGLTRNCHGIISHHPTLAPQHTRLAGFPHRFPRTRPSYILSIGMVLSAQREPYNPADCNAIRLYSPNRHFVGFVPRHVNYAFARHMDAGFSIQARITAINDADPWHGIV